MVFCGKPSKGCKNCRVRRIKCDQKEPSCSQCLRVEKECPGYRDQVALAFRDESAKVVRKAHNPKHRTEQGKYKKIHERAISYAENFDDSIASPSDGSSQSSLVLSPLQHSPSPPPPLSPFLDEGTHFFFSHYVTRIVTKNGNNAPTLLPIWRDLHESPLFANSVSSVGFAGLHNVTKNESHKIIARNKYAVTVSRIKEVLADLETGDLDGTFRSILLLAAYELVNGNSEGSGGWGVHVDGGVALLKLINARQSRQLPGARMQIQFLFSVYIKCLSKGEPIPPSMSPMSHQLHHAAPNTSSGGPTTFTGATLASIVFRCTNLNAAIRSSSSITSGGIVEESLVLIRELNDWEASLPEIWRFATVKVTNNLEDSFNGAAHDYHDMWTARIWNNFRWANIIINEILIVHMAHLGSTSCEDIAQRKESLATISRMATDICSSVHGQFSKYGIKEAQNGKVTPMAGCFLLMFPLAIAGSALEVSQGVHVFAIRILEKIGNTMGIQQALAMVNLTIAQRDRWKKEGMPGAALKQKPLPRFMCFYDG